MNSESSDKIVIYDFPSVQKIKPRFWLLGLLVLLPGFLSIQAFQSSPNGLWKIHAVLFGILFAIMLVAYGMLIVLALVRGRSTFDIPEKTVKLERFFLNRQIGRCKMFRFGDLKAVVINQKIGRKLKASYVGLNLLSGQTFWIKYFPNVPGESTNSQAAEMAGQLARHLGVPVNQIA